MLNSFVIADPRRCLGCYTCMAACAVSHQRRGLQGRPRLHLTYSRLGTMPIQCHHCEDAPCAAICPVKAIEVKEGMVLLKEAACIGCKMCALVCPFGAISLDGVSPLAPEKTVTSPHPLLAWLAGQKRVAIKCDLCYTDGKGPECVQVCPTKALHLVAGEEVEHWTVERRAGSVAAVTQIFQGGKSEDGEQKEPPAVFHPSLPGEQTA